MKTLQEMYMYLWTRKNWLNFGSHSHPDDDPRIFLTIVQRCEMGNFSTIWFISLGKTHWILVKILSQMYLWTSKALLNFGSRLDSRSRLHSPWQKFVFSMYSRFSFSTYVWPCLACLAHMAFTVAKCVYLGSKVVMMINDYVVGSGNELIKWVCHQLFVSVGCRWSVSWLLCDSVSRTAICTATVSTLGIPQGDLAVIDLTYWLSALAMLLQGHATAALLWIVSSCLCLGQDESRRVQSCPCQHSRSWLHRAIFSLVALVLAGRVHTLPMPALDSDLVPFLQLLVYL